MSSSKPFGRAAALAFALCLAAPAAFAGSDGQGWLGGIFDAPAKSQPNTDARYPASVRGPAQGGGSGLWPNSDARYPTPVSGVPQYSTAPAWRNSDARYPSSEQGL
jgi:hypothetical protein